MPSYITPEKNAEYIFYISLVSQADTKLFQTNPTLAAGDVKVSTDGGAEGNISTLPVVTPAGSKRVKITLSASEMNGDNVQLTFSDAAGAEWCDLTINIQTTVTQIDDLATAAALATVNAYVDELETRLTAARAGYLDNLNGHTPQTGDSYAIVNNVSYGNAQLVRSTTPANTLGVDVNGRVDVGSVGGTAQTANDNGADLNTLITRIPQILNLTVSGNIGINWGSVENPTTVVDLSATDIQLADTVTNVTNLHADAATSVQVDRNADLIESQRGAHTWQGNTWYVDPANGNDTTGDGSRAAPYATVTKAHTSATDNNHDVIFLVAGNTGGATTLTEQVTISKNYLFIRGPGRDFYWDYNANGDVITVTGVGVELSGFVLSTHTAGSGDGINISGDFCKVHNVWVEYARQYGIYIDNADWCQIYDNTIHDCGKDAASAGVYIFQNGAGTSDYNAIYNNNLNNNAGAGIETSGVVQHSTIKKNNIHSSSTYGVIIGTGGVENSTYENQFSNNTSGDISDSGTNTHSQNNEQWATETGILQMAYEGSETFQDFLRLARAGIMGNRDGFLTGSAGTGTCASADGAKTRITAPHDANGNTVGNITVDASD